MTTIRTARSDQASEERSADRSGTASLPLLVSLTTLPSRIAHLRPTLDSLLSQTRRPDKILLCLPARSRREGRGYDRPDWLADYAPLLEIVDGGEDFGPATKLLGALPRLGQPACLIVVDDDMQYKSFFLDGLYRAQIAETGSSFSYYVYPCGAIQVGQGADGFAFYTPNLDDLPAFAGKALQCPQLWIMDDVWFAAYLKTKGVPVKSLAHLIEGQGPVYEASHLVNQLQHIEGDLERQHALRVGTRYMYETGLMGRPAQIAAHLKNVLRQVRDTLRPG